MVHFINYISNTHHSFVETEIYTFKDVQNCAVYHCNVSYRENAHMRCLIMHAATRLFTIVRRAFQIAWEMRRHLPSKNLNMPFKLMFLS